MNVGGVMTTRLVAVSPDEAVSEALTRMNDANVGSVVVTDGPRLAGIFTERDVLRLAGRGPDFLDRPVREVMTARPVTVSADDTIVAAAQLMGERRIRHLPVVEGENVVGMVGIRDVMRRLVELVWSDHDERARETARSLLGRG